MSTHKIRLDAELVAQGFFNTCEQAQRAVMAGEVSGENRRFAHAGEPVLPGTYIHVRRTTPYVSRGAEKLLGALYDFKLDVSQMRCVDVGCSTGGFTDALLRSGAAHVLAIDVGFAQFAWELRTDSRTTIVENTRVQDVDLDEWKQSAQLVVCDVSFCSLCDVAAAIYDFLAPAGRALLLVKPQFEAPRASVEAGGIVRDETVQQMCVSKVRSFYESQGFKTLGSVPSKLKGRKGNQEFFLLMQKEGE